MKRKEEFLREQNTRYAPSGRRVGVLDPSSLETTLLRVTPPHRHSEVHLFAHVLRNLLIFIFQRKGAPSSLIRCSLMMMEEIP